MQLNHFHIYADATERNNSTVCSLIDRRRRFIYPPPSETGQPINCQIKPYNHSILQVQIDTCNRRILTTTSQKLINAIGFRNWTNLCLEKHVNYREVFCKSEMKLYWKGFCFVGVIQRRAERRIFFIIWWKGRLTTQSRWNRKIRNSLLYFPKVYASRRNYKTASPVDFTAPTTKGFVVSFNSCSAVINC